MMSRYGRPGFTISISAPSLTSRSCRTDLQWDLQQTPVNPNVHTHKATYHSSNGESSGSGRQLIAASVPKRRLWLCSVSVYTDSLSFSLNQFKELFDWSVNTWSCSTHLPERPVITRGKLCTVAQHWSLETERKEKICWATTLKNDVTFTPLVIWTFFTLNKSYDDTLSSSCSDFWLLTLFPNPLDIRACFMALTLPSIMSEGAMMWQPGGQQATMTMWLDTYQYNVKNMGEHQVLKALQFGFKHAPFRVHLT